MNNFFPLLLTAAYTIDTSKINIYDLKDRIKNWIGLSDDTQPIITIESFGFKNGIPIDSDLMLGSYKTLIGKNKFVI